jgi:hypothetical protein
MLPVTATADTLNYLTVKNAGEKTAVKVDGLNVITFTNDNMVINSTNCTQSISLDTFEKMLFTRNQPGDVNADGTVSVGDITSIAEIVLTGSTDGVDAVAADMDDNGDITVGDITKVADVILNQNDTEN